MPQQTLSGRPAKSFGDGNGSEHRPLAGGTVDHGDQVQLLPPPFQPVVLTGVPLHQFAAPAAPRPPYMPLLGRPPPASTSEASPGLPENRACWPNARWPRSVRIPGIPERRESSPPSAAPSPRSCDSRAVPAAASACVMSFLWAFFNVTSSLHPSCLSV
jgi:hypothetical protein